MKAVETGNWDETTISTTPEMGVSHLGPAASTYSTPAMVAHFEALCMKMLIPFLDPGENSVGYRVDVKHIAPTPIGMKITVKGRIKRVDGRKVLFDVEAYNETSAKIGEGVHERSVIDMSRFGGPTG